MIFKGILNGCSTNIVAQAEELNGFISEHLSSKDNIGSTILFYSKKAEGKMIKKGDNIINSQIWIECYGCGAKGPKETDRKVALKSWNNLSGNVNKKSNK